MQLFDNFLIYVRTRRRLVLRIILWVAATYTFLGACSGGGQTTSGGLYITSSPSGAEVRVDGEFRGRTPLTVRELEPREYEVVFRLDGYQDAQVITSVQPRQISPVTGTLSAAREPVTHRMAYVSNRDGAFEVWTSDEYGSNAVRWTSLRWPRQPLMAAVAPDGSYFAANFDSTAGLTTLLLTAPRRSGEDPPIEVRTVGGDIFRILQWSLDSRFLLLKNLVSQTIWVAGVNGNVNPVLIPDVPRGVLTAAYAPMPGFIAYVDYERTYLIGLDGSRRQVLAENGEQANTFLRFSRDGRRLAHVRVAKLTTYNAGELWLMNTDGSNLRRLSLVGSQDFEPVWSQDGRRIIFVHRENVEDVLGDLESMRLVSNLWLYDLDTQLLRPLTSYRKTRVRQPSISLDDQRVTFVSNATGYDEIWIVDLHGGEPYPLTKDRATALFPMWLW
jgi:dipeptidyl aminopeptidase/acylaminoacyl peptidase